MARGRPRQFDRVAALRQAIELFWHRGYQGTSISDLTERMGIGSPSLYAAFGSKAALFREAAELYQTDEGALPGRQMEEASSGRAAVELMLRANVDLFTRPAGPRSCLLTRAVMTCPPDNKEVRVYLERTSRQRLRSLEHRLHRAFDAGEALPTGDVSALAGLYDALLQGLAVRSHEGASRRTLHRYVDAAMDSWDAMVGAVEPR